MRNSTFVAILASLYVLVYILSIHYLWGEELIMALFFGSPVIMLWLVISVLKDTSAQNITLEEGDEWGYRDWKK